MLRAFQTSNNGSALFTSAPIEAAASKRLFQLGLLAISTFFGYKALLSYRTLATAARFPAARALCLVPLALRDPTLPPAAARLAAFAPLQDGCRMPYAASVPNISSALSLAPAPAATAAEEESTALAAAVAALPAGAVCADFGSSAVANGYVLVTSDGPAAADPVRWRVDAWVPVETSAATSAAGTAAAANLSAQDGQRVTAAAAARGGGGGGGGGGGWVAVGASEWRVFFNGEVALASQLAFATPLARGAKAEVDMRPGWPWALDWFVDLAVNCAGYFLCAGLAAAGRPRLAKPVFLVTFVKGILLFIVAALGYHAAGRLRAAAGCWLEVPPQLLAAVGLAWAEHRIVAILAALGASLLLYAAALEALVYSSSPNEVASALAFCAGNLVLAFAALVLALRTRILHAARRMLRHDGDRYRAAWLAILSGADEPDASSSSSSSSSSREAAATRAQQHLAEVAVETAALAHAAARGPGPRQLCRRFNPAAARASAAGGEGEGEDERGTTARRFSRALLRRASSVVVAAAVVVAAGWGEVGYEVTALVDERCWVAGTADPRRPVASLEQLFVQAACLHPILLAKVRAWAAASCGWLPSRLPAAPTDAAAAAREERLWKGGYWSSMVSRDCQHSGVGEGAKLKSISRALEKMYRVYHKDPSRLADICRQSIIFPSPAALAACLAAIRADPEARPARVKNRLDPRYDAGTASGGYRDVAVNLRVDSARTRALGVEGHVCEVQLLLEPFARLKDDEGHRRYVAFRNLRGE